MPTSPSLTEADHEAFLFADCLAYYNVIMRPQLIGCLIPNQPREFHASEWMSTPPLMKHNTVYALAMHRMARGEDFPELKTQLLVHRGRTVVLLREALEALSMTTWAPMVFIVTFLGGEIGMSSVSGWQTHFEAAWRMLAKVGGSEGGGWKEGVKICWTLGEEPQLACVYLLQIEIFSLTTAPVWSSGCADSARLVEVLGDNAFADMDDRIVTSTCPCPLEILKILAEINGMRATLYASRRGDSRAPQDDFDGYAGVSAQLWSTFTRLLCFQAEAWVERILQRHAAQVVYAETVGGFDRRAMKQSWIALGESYRSAAVIYLIRACSSAHLSKALPEECKAFMDDPEAILDEHRKSLSEKMEFLLEGFTTAKNDVHRPILWRFIQWPLFIDAYESIAYGLDNRIESDSIRRPGNCQVKEVSPLVTRLRCLGRALGTMSLSDAADILEKVQLERQVRKTWEWDDAFPQRVIFAI